MRRRSFCTVIQAAIAPAWRRRGFCYYEPMRLCRRPGDSQRHHGAFSYGRAWPPGSGARYLRTLVALGRGRAFAGTAAAMGHGSIRRAVLNGDEADGEDLDCQSPGNRDHRPSSPSGIVSERCWRAKTSPITRSVWPSLTMSPYIASTNSFSITTNRPTS